MGSKYTWQHILQVLLLKISAGHLQPCVEQETTQTRQQCLDLNMAILGKLDDKVSGVYVASPVTGMALTLEYIYAWCLRTWLQQPKATQNDIAENIWQGLQAHGRVLVDEAGKNLSTREEHFKLIADKLSNAKTLRQLWQTLGLLP